MTFQPHSLNLIGKCAAALLLACTVLPASAQQAQPKTSESQTHGISLANMDRSIIPGDNFYLYCNGDWIKNTELPSAPRRASVFSPLTR